MYTYNRRQYINRESEKKIEKNVSEGNENTDINTTITDLKSLTLGSLKLLFENIDEIKNSIKKIDDRIMDLSLRISGLENHFDNNENYKKIQIQPVFDEIKTKFAPVKDDATNDDEAYQSDIQNSTPMMPGSGFSNITADYLRNLSKKR